MNAEAKRRIKENKANQHKELDLRDLELTAIPLEIKDFVWLEVLSLSQNPIKKIEGLDNLVQLQRLDLALTQIEKIEGLDNLVHLQILELYQTQIEKIEGLDNLDNLKELDLAQTQIEKIEGLDHLVHLQRLYLYQTKIAKIEGLDHLAQLQRLYLYQTKIEKIEGLDNLDNLKELHLAQTQIEKIEGLDNLDNLKELHLAQTKIEKIEGLDHLVHLQRLDLYQTKIEKIEGLDNLDNLKELYLYQTKIEKIEGLDNLVQLQRLYLYQTKIEKIEGLDNLVQLQRLSLYQTKIEKIEGLDNLVQLQILHLYQTQIEKIEGLDNLVQLQRLSLSQTKIEKIEGLDNLVQLQRLSLSQTKIEKIEGLDNLFKLELLDLSETEIEDLSHLYDFLVNRQIEVHWDNSEWHSTEGLYLKDCYYLKIPSPEWVQQGTTVVLDYLKAAKEQDVVEKNEAKVMLVGRPYAGKTSLSIKLRASDGDLPDSEGTTRGVEVEDWHYTQNGTDYTAHLWDFGGQDIQYAIHQFFMTQRAIYILLDCTRDPNHSSNIMGDNKGEMVSNYWLQTIENIANSSPTYYVYNVYKSYAEDLSVYNALKQKYEFLKGYEAINLHEVCKDNEAAINKVRDTIQKAIANLPTVGVVLPTKWAKIKDVLEKEAENNSHIRIERFFKICEDNDVNDEKSKLLVSRYFHEIGSIIHYSNDTTKALYRIIILRRKWATKATYDVVLDKDIREIGKGRFTTKDLERIWKNSEYKNNIPELLELLERFKICYKLPDSSESKYLIPQLLPSTLPDGIEKHLDNPLTIRYDYDFMPYGIVNRLTVDLHKNVDETKVWNKGFVLNRDGGQVLVIEYKNFNTGHIAITFSGDQQRRWKLLEDVREHLDDLNKRYNLSDSVKQEVPCDCTDCQEKIKEKKEPYWHAYKALLTRLKKKSEAECKDSGNDVEILGLIDQAFADRPQEVERILSKDKHGFDLNIERMDVIMGDVIKEKNIATDNAQIKRDTTNTTAENSIIKNDSIVNPTIQEAPKKLSILEYFRVRKLLGWTVGAIALGFIAYSVPIFKDWAALFFVGVLGYGVFTSLTADGTYIRYSKWAIGMGVFVTGILNIVPPMSGVLLGEAATKYGWINFFIQVKEGNPLVTLVILAFFFALAAFALYLSKEKNSTMGKDL